MTQGIETIEELTRGDAMLDLLFTNKKELFDDVNVKGSLGSSDCEINGGVQDCEREKKGK